MKTRIFSHVHAIFEFYNCSEVVKLSKVKIKSSNSTYKYTVSYILLFFFICVLYYSFQGDIVTNNFLLVFQIPSFKSKVYKANIRKRL